MRELRWLCRFHGGEEVGLIAKIEKREALEAFDEILAASDGIMVARGDLGVETPAEEVPLHQKDIIRRCNQVGKPVITATQMLNSMISNPRPTRAEASDVANAIFDGSDAVMLSGETASGKFPVIAIETMANIAMISERNFERLARVDATARLAFMLTEGVEDATSREGYAVTVSRAASQIADVLDAKLIVTTTYTGSTARQVARTRPRTNILCVTPNEKTYRKLALVWGIYPMMISEFNTVDEMIGKIVALAYEARIVAFDDILVIIAGVPFGTGGHANFVKIHKVGEAGEVPEPLASSIPQAR
jgi:pyruvate kinase